MVLHTLAKLTDNAGDRARPHVAPSAGVRQPGTRCTKPRSIIWSASTAASNRFAQSTLFRPLHPLVDKERELKADTRITLFDRCRRNKPGRFTRLQQIDKRVAELEGGRLLVLDVDGSCKTSR